MAQSQGIDLTNPKHSSVLIKVLQERTFQNLIGGEDWDLTEAEEVILWEIIKGLDNRKESDMRGDT